MVLGVVAASTTTAAVPFVICLSAFVSELIESRRTVIAGSTFTNLPCRYNGEPVADAGQTVTRPSDS